MRKYYWKKIKFSDTRYCIVRMYRTKADMQKGYEDFRPHDKRHYKVLGVCCPYEKYDCKGRKPKLSGEIATVFLSFETAGVDITTHELLHAVLWAYKFKKNKIQHPIVIKSMASEEALLHTFSHVVHQFYKWFMPLYNKHKAA